MTTEAEKFDLSKKIESANIGRWGHSSVYLHQDVKEFIRLLKDYIQNFEGIWERGQCVRGDIITKINKLSGDKLTK